MTAVGRRGALHVNGVELNYIEVGFGGRETVVLLHGGMGDLESWTHQVRALADRHRVVTYSRRRSHPNRNRDIERDCFAEYVDDDIADLLALKRALHAGRLHLVGTSYGALLALELALRAPREVASLVLAEPPLLRWACASETGGLLFDAFMDVWGAAAAAFGAGLCGRALKLLTEAMWGHPVFDCWPSDRVAAVTRNAGAMHALTRAQHPFPEIDRLRVQALRTPTLLVQGALTSALHRLVMTELCRAMPDARRAEISLAGHASPSERPEYFSALVVAFLESLSSRAGSRAAQCSVFKDPQS